MPEVRREVTGDDKPLAESANRPASNDQGTTNELKEIRRGERWLIGTGILSVVVNIVLGCIYWGQLQQMKVATDENRKSIGIAQDALEYSASQFDRSQKQTITQANASIRSSKAAENAANAAETSNEQSNVHFRADVRPFFLLSSTSSTGFRDGHFYMDIFPVNYGKYPAIVTSAEQHMFIGADAMNKADEWFAKLSRPQRGQREHPQGLLPPGIPAKQEGAWRTIKSEEVWDENTLYNLIHSTSGAVVVVYSVHYEDIWGTQYRTDSCLASLPSEAFGQCAKHNDAK